MNIVGMVWLVWYGMVGSFRCAKGVVGFIRVRWGHLG